MTAARPHPTRTTSAGGHAVAVAVGFMLAAGMPTAYAAPPAPGMPLGTRIQVNATTANQQRARAAAMDATGDSVVVWTDYGGTDGSGTGVFAQRYERDGSPVGSEFQVNTYTPGDQASPDVAMDASGNFVVVWTSNNQAAVDSAQDVYARRFRADGTAYGGEMLVNTVTSNQQLAPAVAMSATGAFVVAWHDERALSGKDFSRSTNRSDIFARHYDKDGNATGGEFRVNTVLSGWQNAPAVAMAADGRFVVVWEHQPASAEFIISARRYWADAVPIGGGFQVNTTTSTYQGKAAVDMDAAGDFVVAWLSRSGGNHIVARRYQDGTAAGGEFQVDTIATATSERGHPVVAMDANGGFVVAWGDPYGPDYPSVAMDAAGDWMAAWTGYNGADGDGAGVFAQRYARETSLDIKSTLALAPAGTVEAGAGLALTAGIENTEPPATLTGNATIDAALTEASGLTATLTLPEGAAFGKATGAGWTCPATVAGGVVTCTYGLPLAAASATENLTISVTAPSDAAGTFAFSNTVFGDQPDAATANNNAAVDVTVTQPAGIGEDDNGTGSDTGDNDSGGSESGNSDTADNSGGTGNPAPISFGGGGALSFLSFGLLGLPLLRKRRRV